MRDFLKGLDLDKELIDTIMAEYGKNIQGLKEQVEEYKSKVNEYEAKVNELTDKSKDSAKVQEELEALKKGIAEKEEQEKAKKDDELLTSNILSVFGDKKFTSDYAKNGLLQDIKKELNKEENKGKGIKDIFDELTKDKTDIFENPNQIKDMAGMQDIDNGISKEDFDKMSYNERVEFKQSNPELFAKFNN